MGFTLYEDEKNSMGFTFNITKYMNIKEKAEDEIDNED